MTLAFLPFPRFRAFSAAGDPLAGGLLYSYAATTDTPLALLTSDGSTSATNPVELDANGEADVRLGPSAYKLVLKTSAGVTLWTMDNILNALEPGGLDDYSATAAQMRLTHDPGEAGTESLATSMSGELERLRQILLEHGEALNPLGTYWYETRTRPEWVNVKAYGALGDGTTNDATAIQAAFNASKRVFFPAGTYFLGSHSGNDNIIDLSALGDDIRIHTAGKVEFLCTTTFATAVPRIFYLKGNNNFYCEPVHFRDTGFTLTPTGAVGFYLSNLNTAVNWGNCTFESITSVDMTASMFCVANPVSATTRIRGVHIGTLNSYNCYYGFNCQNDGDGVTIDSLTAYQNKRPYYVYGVAGHTVSRLFNRYPRPSTGQVLIARQVGGLNTRGITVNYTCRDSAADYDTNYYHVSFQHVDLLGGEIADCTVNINIDDTAAVNYYPVSFINYTGSGGSETTGASSNYVQDIRLSGSCNAYGQDPHVVATYAARRQMRFTSGRNFLVSQELVAAFQLTQSSRANTDLQWTAVTVNPDIGNGTLRYDIDIVNGMVTLNIHLTMGSTTTYGTGGWIFDGWNPNFNCKATSLGSWYALDSGTGYYTGVAKISANSDNIFCFYSGGGDTVKSSIPHTWAVNDTLDITITFPIS